MIKTWKLKLGVIPTVSRIKNDNSSFASNNKFFNGVLTQLNSMAGVAQWQSTRLWSVRQEFDSPRSLLIGDKDER